MTATKVHGVVMRLEVPRTEARAPDRGLFSPQEREDAARRPEIPLASIRRLTSRRAQARAPVWGFSLIELLLTVVLLLMLLGAVVFSFSTLQKGAAFNEGTTRFATMLRYARAHAAYTGRSVRLQLQPPAPDAADLMTTNRSFVLQWEPDPLQAPGRFRNLPATSWDLDKLNELVAIEVLEIPRPLMNRSLPSGGVASGVVVEEAARGTEFAEEPALMFYPDGASDTARIILVPRDAEDSRRMEVRLEGLTGTVESAFVAAEDTGELESGLEPEAELEPALLP